MPPLTFIGSAHVRRALSLADNRGVEGGETIQDLLKELKLLEMGVTSAIEDIEAMTDANPQSISREIHSLKFATMYVNTLQESLPREMKIERGVDLLRPDDRQRRIELAIANAESHPLLNCDSYAVLKSHFFYRICPDGWDICDGDFDCRSFISAALAMFRINSGIVLPTDVVYDDQRGFYVAYSRRLDRDERQAKLAKFQTTIMIFFQTLLRSPLRIEKDEQGKVMLFYD